MKPIPFDERGATLGEFGPGKKAWGAGTGAQLAALSEIEGLGGTAPADLRVYCAPARPTLAQTQPDAAPQTAGVTASSGDDQA